MNAFRFFHPAVMNNKMTPVASKDAKHFLLPPEGGPDSLSYASFVSKKRVPISNVSTPMKNNDSDGLSSSS